MNTRVYHVTHNRTGKARLIRSNTQAQAIRHAAQTRFDIEVAGQDDLVGLLTAGHPVELAGGPATAGLADQRGFGSCFQSRPEKQIRRPSCNSKDTKSF